MSKVFGPGYLLLDIDVKTQKEAFESIANLAHSLKITNNPNGLVNDLIKREEISTTGMSDAVAIPHAMSADFNFPAIIVARFKNGVEWKAIGGEPVKVAFALLIPEKDRSTLHMEYLQNIATALLNKEFNEIVLKSNDRNKILDTIAQAIEKKQEARQSDAHVSNDSKGLIIGVSACATGIAHTYMAREALEKFSKDVGYDVWIETQGQSGQEHKLSEDMIKKANYVIIAADIHVEMERFTNKKVYMTSTNEAINTPKKALDNTINKSIIYKSTSNKDIFESSTRNVFMKHFLNGVSHMIPFLVFSGIFGAILTAIIFAVYGTTTQGDSSILGKIQIISQIGFTLFASVMGGYIAVSIAGRAALAPGIIATMAATMPQTYMTYNIPWMMHAQIGNMSLVSNVSIGIFGALIMGFGAGYLTNCVNKIKFHKYLKPVVPIIIIPLVVTLALVLPFSFAFSGILGCGMNWFAASLGWLGTSHVRILIGFILGAMIGFDMGGPINKIAFATGASLLSTNPEIMGSVAAAIPIAPLGCGLASLLFAKSNFNNEERGLGVSALILGFMGISEGAIPFASKRIKKTVIANVIGSAIAGGMASLFMVADVAPQGGLVMMFCLAIHPSDFATSPFTIGTNIHAASSIVISCAWYTIAICIGTLIHSIIYATMIKTEGGKKLGKSFKEIFSKQKISV